MAKKTKKGQFVSEEADRIMARMVCSASMFNRSRSTCSRAVGAELIRRGIIYSRGLGYYAVTEHLGCGVYLVTCEPSS